MIDAYLKELSEALRFDSALSAIVLQEVRDHLEEALAQEQLNDRQEAERRVVERFGDPWALAAQFASISLTRVMRRLGIVIVIATIAVMVMMKARVFWYAFFQWTLNESARPFAHFGSPRRSQSHHYSILPAIERRRSYKRAIVDAFSAPLSFSNWQRSRLGYR
jgi:hypothetical protein